MKNYSVVGNNKKVTMANNSTSLKVVGNNCIVNVSVNQGDIEVIGNNCKVDISDNFGGVSLVGQNGLVTIKRRYTGDRALLVGACSHMVVDGEKKSTNPESQLSPFSKDLDDVIDSIFSFVMR